MHWAASSYWTRTAEFRSQAEGSPPAGRPTGEQNPNDCTELLIAANMVRCLVLPLGA